MVNRSSDFYRTSETTHPVFQLAEAPSLQYYFVVKLVARPKGVVIARDKKLCGRISHVKRYSKVRLKFLRNISKLPLGGHTLIANPFTFLKYCH